MHVAVCVHRHSDIKRHTHSIDKIILSSVFNIIKAVPLVGSTRDHSAIASLKFKQEENGAYVRC